MKIQINTDNHIQGNEALIDKFSKTIEQSLSRVSNHITRVEIHLSDVNDDKGGNNNKRCLIEARLEGRQPIVVIDQSATPDQSLDGAINKLISMIDTIIGRRHDQRNHRNEILTPEQKNPEE
jgi:hypothetical protein